MGFFSVVLLTAFGFNAAVGWMAAGLARLADAGAARGDRKDEVRRLFFAVLSPTASPCCRWPASFCSVPGCLVRGGLAGVSGSVSRLSFGEIGAFVLGIKGIVQDRRRHTTALGADQLPGASALQFWSALLTAIPALIAVALWRQVMFRSRSPPALPPLGWCSP